MEFWQSVTFTEPEQLIDIAKCAEKVGFAGVLLADHLVTPQTITSPYPYTEDGKVSWEPGSFWPDPWVMSGVLASHTTRLRFLTAVYVLPLRDLFTAAKAVSTVARVSDNRVILGVGVGWMKDEFQLTGQDFHTRGRRTDEMLEAMRLIFAGGMVGYQGRLVDFPPVEMSPVPTKPVPVYVGGETDAALRRAARWDGWLSGVYSPEQLLINLARLDKIRRAEGTHERGSDVIASLPVPPDVELFKRLRDAGVTGIINFPWYYQGTPTSTIEYKQETLARFAEQYIAPLSE